LPGVKKEDIKVDIEGDQVSIRPSRAPRATKKTANACCTANATSARLSRAFRLSQEIDEARASAKYADGVLELTLPKKATAAAKQRHDPVIRKKHHGKGGRQAAFFFFFPALKGYNRRLRCACR